MNDFSPYSACTQSQSHTKALHATLKNNENQNTKHEGEKEESWKWAIMPNCGSHGDCTSNCNNYNVKTTHWGI